MSFTGERYIPGEGGCQIAYEHLHRYFFALRWAGGCNALDLACGSGYGAALLARRARHVWALDIDDETIRGAQAYWHRDNLTFLQGDAARLPFQDGSIDLVVAMETLEHIEDQGQLLHEITRVCGASGVALISTPNKAEYSDARNYTNPFHKRELYLEEFVDMLKEHFPCVEIAGQQIRAGSVISSSPSGSSCEIFEEPVCGNESAVVKPMYYLAICSRNKLQEPIPSRSAYLDSTDGLMLEGKREIARLGEWGKSLENVVGDRDRTIRGLQRTMKDAVEARDRNIRSLQDSLSQEVDLRDRAIRELQNTLAQEVDARDQAIRNLQQEMQTEIGDRDNRIIALLELLHQKEKEFDDRGRWALSLQAEVERLSAIRRKFLYRILSRPGLLPK